LNKDDKVLIGLSGGKDSFVLLEILASLKKSLAFPVELHAVHVAVQTAGFRINKEYIQEFCDHLEIPFHYRIIHPELENSTKAACFVCSWHRRTEIFNLGKELGCNKLSFGHHRDDALETFMMNLMYHGSISSLPYSLSMFDGRVRLIRPMLDLWEKDIEEYAGLREFKLAEKNCRYEKETKRKYSRDILQKMEEDYPVSKMNIFRAMDNIYTEYLPENYSKKIKKNL
jgi:tRNA(Ile)-lysidine synthase TilS/MesJ